MRGSGTSRAEDCVHPCTLLPLLCRYTSNTFEEFLLILLRYRRLGCVLNWLSSQPDRGSSEIQIPVVITLTTCLIGAPSLGNAQAKVFRHATSVQLSNFGSVYSSSRRLLRFHPLAPSLCHNHPLTTKSSNICRPSPDGIPSARGLAKTVASLPYFKPVGCSSTARKI